MIKSRFLLFILLFASVVAGAQNSSFAAGARTLPASAGDEAAERPLQALPYTPSLDVPSMDRTADPCVDFYQYTCGGWMKSNPIPPDQARWSVYHKVANENLQFLWGILDGLSKATPGRTPVQQKIGDYFTSCMDTAAIEERGVRPIQPVLKQIAEMKSKTEFAGWLAAQHLEGAPAGLLFGFGSDQDYGDATQVIAFAVGGGLSLPDRDYYLKTDAKSVEQRQRYVEHVAKMLLLSGESEAQSGADAATVMRIETALAKATLSRVDKRDPYKLYHRMAPAELQRLTPDFDWSAFLGGVGLGGVQTVNVTEPEFFKAVEAELQVESLENWRAYFHWHVVSGASRFLSKPFGDENFNFYLKYLRGVDQQKPRWKRCVGDVDTMLGEALGQEFVRRTFAEKTKQDTVHMTELIEKAMAQEISALDWMSPETKKQALIKLNSIRNKVGYPDKWRDYSAVHIAANDFFGNYQRAASFEVHRDLNKIGKPVDKNEWGMTPPTVNAYYNPQMNDINFPAGVLQPPLYDPKMDAAPNYGNTGSTIGHELTHGFDDEGRQFDAAGNLKDWWTAEDAKKFEEKVNCVRDQFGGYVVVDDIKINSKLTSGEDVADLGGTLLAYIAWREATKDLKLQPVEGFTPEQRFFIGFAQWACENARPEELRANAITDPHSPGKYRINGIVSDLPEFQQAFGCKNGQPMVHANACKVW
ncbi:MAG: M13 family metallopeptidase [Candidatus Korobacteraceae bacterium]|jgi:endothelin-converting enzyme/putative endopeptidase